MNAAVLLAEPESSELVNRLRRHHLSLQRPALYFGAAFGTGRHPAGIIEAQP